MLVRLVYLMMIRLVGGHGQVPLAAGYLIADVLAGRRGGDVVGCPDRLGVQDHRGRVLRPAGLLPRLTAQQIMNRLVSAIIAPRCEVAVRRGQGLSLTGPDGLLRQLTKTVLETALNEEMTDHLGYAKHESDGVGSGNVRNGSRSKKVLTDASGPVQIDVPRDRAGTFESQAKRHR